MKDAFKALLPLSQEEFDDTFEQATIVLDTNVLLDLYRYSRQSTDSFFDLLNDVSAQLWMPYQAGLEFLRNRGEARRSVTSSHTERIDALKALRNTLVNGPERSHVGRDDAEKRFVRSLDKYLKQLEAERGDLRRWATDPVEDSTLDRIQVLYAEKSQQRPDAEWYGERVREGADRYKRKFPPGYMDAKKEDDSKYGDYFLWAQCIAIGKERKTPLVLVTGDLKEDWWNKPSHGDRTGPRVELQQEYFDSTGELLLMFDTRQFFRHLRQRRLQEGDTQELKDAEKEIAAVQSASEYRSPSRRHGYVPGQLALTDATIKDFQNQWDQMQRNTIRPLREYIEDLRLTSQAEAVLRDAILNLRAAEGTPRRSRGTEFSIDAPSIENNGDNSPAQDTESGDDED